MRGLSVLDVMIGAHARIDRGLFGSAVEFLGFGTAEKAAREKAHAMLFGANGAGKSTLMKAIIGSSRWRRARLIRRRDRGTRDTARLGIAYVSETAARCAT